MFNLHSELKAYRLTKNYNKYLLKYNSDLAVLYIHIGQIFVLFILNICHTFFIKNLYISY